MLITTNPRCLFSYRRSTCVLSFGVSLLKTTQKRKYAQGFLLSSIDPRHPVLLSNTFSSNRFAGRTFILLNFSFSQLFSGRHSSSTAQRNETYCTCVWVLLIPTDPRGGVPLLSSVPTFFLSALSDVAPENHEAQQRWNCHCSQDSPLPWLHYANLRG